MQGARNRVVLISLLFISLFVVGSSFIQTSRRNLRPTSSSSTATNYLSKKVFVNRSCSALNSSNKMNNLSQSDVAELVLDFLSNSGFSEAEKTLRQEMSKKEVKPKAKTTRLQVCFVIAIRADPIASVYSFVSYFSPFLYLSFFLFLSLFLL
jgi:hypothetical protein